MWLYGCRLRPINGPVYLGVLIRDVSVPTSLYKETCHNMSKISDVKQYSYFINLFFLWFGKSPKIIWFTAAWGCLSSRGCYGSHSSSHKTHPTPRLIGWLCWWRFLCLTPHSSLGNICFSAVLTGRVAEEVDVFTSETPVKKKRIKTNITGCIV